MENYPQLKSNENFLRLQDELAGTENRIAVERKRYNDALQDYNTYVLQFPASLYAGSAGFKQNPSLLPGYGSIARGAESGFWRETGSPRCRTRSGAGALSRRS